VEPPVSSGGGPDTPLPEIAPWNPVTTIGPSATLRASRKNWFFARRPGTPLRSGSGKFTSLAYEFFSRPFLVFLAFYWATRRREMATAACSAERSLATKAIADSSSYDLNGSTKGYLMESSPVPIGVHLPMLDPVPPLLPLVEHDINLFSPSVFV
jgi:hypothetical protein